MLRAAMCDGVHGIFFPSRECCEVLIREGSYDKHGFAPEHLLIEFLVCTWKSLDKDAVGRGCRTVPFYIPSLSVQR